MLINKDTSESEEKEVAGVEMLSKLLSHRESWSDVSLEGTDGMRVKANRCILAAKSTVFEKMLYGGFEEASSPIVKIGFEGTVLEAIVEYCYTDSLKTWSCVPNEDALWLGTLLKLHDAATYFNLPRLCRKVHSFIISWVEVKPSLSLALLEAGTMQGMAFPDNLKEIAMSNIRLAKMKPETVKKLSPAVMEEIVKDSKHHMPELYIFHILKTWAEGEEAGNKRKAKELSKHIRLELIHPKQLSEVVDPSGLVSEKQLLRAYKAQALSLSKAHGASIQTARSTKFRWRDTSKDVASAVSTSKFELKLLDYPEITTGIRQWTIEVEKHCNYTYLGVAHTGYPLDEQKFLGSQKGGWVCGGNGHTYHNRDAVDNEEDMRDFRGFQKEGSRVTLTLNLRDENGGTLSAGVNGGAQIEVFSNLLSTVEGRKGGFVPAASLVSPGRVRILDIQKK